MEFKQRSSVAYTPLHGGYNIFGDAFMKTNDGPAYGDEVLQMVKTAVGQLSAVERMLSDGVCCTEVATQIAAVQGLMKKIVSLMVRDRMAKCLPEKGSEELSKALQVLIEKTSK